MSSPTNPDPTTARRVIDLHVQLQESLRADGYGQDVIEGLLVEHLVALTHGDLREPDGAIVLPTALAHLTEPSHVSPVSMELMHDLVAILNQLGLLAEQSLLRDSVMGMGRWALDA